MTPTPIPATARPRPEESGKRLEDQYKRVGIGAVSAAANYYKQVAPAKDQPAGKRS